MILFTHEFLACFPNITTPPTVPLVERAITTYKQIKSERSKKLKPKIMQY